MRSEPPSKVGTSVSPPASAKGAIAATEKINASYVSRVLRLTLLAPEIVEAILDGRQPTEMTLAMLMRPFSVEWWEQAEALL